MVYTSRYKGLLQSKYTEIDNEKVWSIVAFTLVGVGVGHIIIPSIAYILWQ